MRLLWILLALLLSFGTAHAQQRPESTLYQIPSDVQGAGGGEDARSTNYLLQDTLGEVTIGFGRSTTYDLNAGYRQTLETFLSLTCDGTVALGTITPTGQRTGSGSCTIVTDAEVGYSLSWLASAANMTGASNTIEPFTPASANVPDTWAIGAGDAEWGARLRSSSTDTDVEWGVDGVSEKWLNVRSSSARTIVTRTSATSGAGSTEILQFRAEVGTVRNQPSGTYAVTVTLTATSL